MGRHAGTVGLVFALGIHGALATVVWRMPPPLPVATLRAIQIELQQTPPAVVPAVLVPAVLVPAVLVPAVLVPEVPVPRVPSLPVPPPPLPRAMPRPRPKIPLPEAAPPPPAPSPLPPEAPPDPTPPSVGVTAASVVDDPNAVAVAVGSTLMENPLRRRLPKVGAGSAVGVPGGAGLTPGTAPSGFSPVEDSFLKERPRVLKETQAEYPPEARNLGVGGVVLLRVSVDKRGRVHAVRIVQGVGHGMDEAARTAMLGFEFSPARMPNGTPVDHVITYRFRFDLPY